MLAKRIEISTAGINEVNASALVVAKTMLHNPLHLAVFGSADEVAEKRQIKMFKEVLKLPACNLFVTRQEHKIVGVMNYYQPGFCQISPFQTIGLLPKIT